MPGVVYTFSAVNQNDVLNAYRSIATAARSSAAVQGQVERRAGAVNAEVTRRKIKQEKAWARAAVDAAEKKIAAEKAAGAAGKKNETVLARTLALLKRITRQATARGRAEVDATNRATMAEKRLNAEKKKGWLIGSSSGRVRSLRGGTGMIGLGATGAIMGGMLVGAAGRRALTTDEAVTQLAIKGRRPGQAINTGALKNKIYGSAIGSGIDPAELTKSLMSYVGKTGDIGSALKMTDTFAKYISLGTSGKDIGESAAFLGMKFKIGAGGMDQALSTLAVGGKRNQFELPDFAKQMPKMTSAMKRFNFENTGFKAVAQLGGWAQMAAKGTSGGAQAGTAFENILADLLGGAGKIGAAEGLGVKMKGKGGKMRNFEDIILDVLTATGGEVVGSGSKKGKDFKMGLTDIFKRRSIRGMSAIAEKFADFKDEGAKKGLKTDEEQVQYAAEAMKKFMAEMSNLGDTLAETNQDAALAQQSASNRLKASWAAIESAASDVLIPALEGAASNLPKLVDAAKMVISAFAVLGVAIMALVDLLPDSTETRLAKVKAQKKAKLDEMESISERFRRHSTGKEKLSSGEEKLLARRFNQLSDEIYGTSVTSADGHTVTTTDGLRKQEKDLRNQLIKEGLGDIDVGDGVAVTRGGDTTEAQAKKALAKVATMELDAYDAATVAGPVVGSFLGPVGLAVGAIPGIANLYDRYTTGQGLQKGTLATESDFPSNLPGRSTAAQKVTAAREAGKVELEGGKEMTEAVSAFGQFVHALASIDLTQQQGFGGQAHPPRGGVPPLLAR